MADWLGAVDVEGDNWSLVHIPKPPYYADDINGIFPSQGQLYFANSPADSDGSELSIWVLDDFVTGKWSLKHNSHWQIWTKCLCNAVFFVNMVLNVRFITVHVSDTIEVKSGIWVAVTGVDIYQVVRVYVGA
ncbi:hypothetical protein TRIUR3_19774 [Triticum urartu]|uniref:Uncharacterized protein n=1 Tax=Triticum urartu TaxID=4572 RepID=M7ZZE8_TRIUA|nr:hypothetical protein TRIUR3_19774 [Triticum urartu]